MSDGFRCCEDRPVSDPTKAEKAAREAAEEWHEHEDCGYSYGDPCDFECGAASAQAKLTDVILRHMQPVIDAARSRRADRSYPTDAAQVRSAEDFLFGLYGIKHNDDICEKDGCGNCALLVHMRARDAATIDAARAEGRRERDWEVKGNLAEMVDVLQDEKRQLRAALERVREWFPHEDVPHHPDMLVLWCPGCKIEEAINRG